MWAMSAVVVDVCDGEERKNKDVCALSKLVLSLIDPQPPLP